MILLLRQFKYQNLRSFYPEGYYSIIQNTLKLGQLEEAQQLILYTTMADR